MRSLLLTTLCVSSFLTFGSIAVADTTEISQQAIDKVVVEAGIQRDDVMLTKVQPAEWPDSALGCPTKGHDYMMVTTSGYEVEVMTSSSTFVVHISGDEAVMCEQKERAPQRTARRDQSVIELVQRARSDLATRLGDKGALIVVKSVQSVSADSNGHTCFEIDGAEKPKLEIVLEADGNTYKYYASHGAVAACDNAVGAGPDG